MSALAPTSTPIVGSSRTTTLRPTLEPAGEDDLLLVAAGQGVRGDARGRPGARRSARRARGPGPARRRWVDSDRSRRPQTAGVEEQVLPHREPARRSPSLSRLTGHEADAAARRPSAGAGADGCAVQPHRPPAPGSPRPSTARPTSVLAGAAQPDQADDLARADARGRPGRRRRRAARRARRHRPVGRRPRRGVTARGRAARRSARRAAPAAPRATGASPTLTPVAHDDDRVGDARRPRRAGATRRSSRRRAPRRPRRTSNSRCDVGRRQARGRLVEDEQRRLGDQGAGDREQRLLGAGQVEDPRRPGRCRRRRARAPRRPAPRTAPSRERRPRRAREAAARGPCSRRPSSSRRGRGPGG